MYLNPYAYGICFYYLKFALHKAASPVVVAGSDNIVGDQFCTAGW